MKYSLLDMVQTVLVSMDGDEVNTWNETTESRSVGVLAKTAFYDIASKSELPEHFTLFQLTPSNDAQKPTLMYRPESVHSIKWIKYNVATAANPEANFRDILYHTQEDFFLQMYGLNTTDTSVGSFTHTVNGDPLVFIYQNNRGPMKCTSFDDRTFVFDSYDAAVDSTLQQSKIVCYGGKSASFSMTDNFIPNLDDQQHALWLNETKTLCFSELQQKENTRAEKTARRLWTSLQGQKNVTGDSPSSFDRLPYYGRR